MPKPIALLSVYHKAGIVDFAKALIEHGFDLISSGGTARHLTDAGISVTDVAAITGIPPVLGHRVVTLVPQIHGGLMAADEHLAELEQLGYPRIELLCVDLYPLMEAIRHPEVTETSVIDKTDIGGPALIRSAAKGRRIVICDPEDRIRVLEWLQNGKPNEESFRTALAAKAEGVVAGYALTSARFHSAGKIDGLIGTKVSTCKYGENAWQKDAGLFSTGSDDPLALDRFVLIQGTPPSYNNLADLDRLLQTITHMAAGLRWMDYGAVAVKHGNPCGAAAAVNSWGLSEDADFLKVLERTVEGDTRAIFGGLVLATGEIDEAGANVLLTHGVPQGRRLLDGIIAPSFTSGAIQMLQRKGDKCRLLVNEALKSIRTGALDQAPRFRQVRGGFLRQPNYTFVPPELPFEILQPPELAGTRLLSANFVDAMLAWAVGSTSNSNTVTLVKNGMLIGNGVGQQDRVGCCELAIKRARDAGHDPKGAVAYSDSFFPFPDGPQRLIDAGVRAIFATSGSVNDSKTRELCDAAGVTLYLLPDSEARSFFGH